jgi:hypothetical protein
MGLYGNSRSVYTDSIVFIHSQSVNSFMVASVHHSTGCMEMCVLYVFDMGYVGTGGNERAQ